jgi:hypothetical protein
MASRAVQVVLYTRPEDIPAGLKRVGIVHSTGTLTPGSIGPVTVSYLARAQDAVPGKVVYGGVFYPRLGSVPAGLQPLVTEGGDAMLLKTGQTTVYHVGDDGSYQLGLAKNYTILTDGQFAGTTNIDVPAYAAATLSFTAATKTIADSATGLATFKTGDTIRVRGSASNDGVYTVATGNVAAAIVTTESLADESAGAVVTICKRVAPSNNVVLDNNTGKTWRRYTTGGPAEKCGPTSVGTLVWYDATLSYALHAAAADLQMIASPPTIRIVGGAGEIARYFAGTCIVCSGFAQPANNLPGMVVTAVTVNGADLDLALYAPGVTLVAEAAGGSRGIKIECQSTFAYLAAMNAAGLGGYSDWRVPNFYELTFLTVIQVPNGVPDPPSFPSWQAANYAGSSTSPSTTANEIGVTGQNGNAQSVVKTTAVFVAFVRGGI